MLLPWNGAFRVDLLRTDIVRNMSDVGRVHTDGLPIQEMFPDHDRVDRGRILKCEESKAARLAIGVPDDRACVDFAELGKVISQAVWYKENHTPPAQFSKVSKMNMTLQKGAVRWIGIREKVPSVVSQDKPPTNILL